MGFHAKCGISQFNFRWPSTSITAATSVSYEMVYLLWVVQRNHDEFMNCQDEFADLPDLVPVSSWDEQVED